jgi:hypothetical protein
MSEKGSADDSRRNSWGVELGSMDRRTRFQVRKVMNEQSGYDLKVRKVRNEQNKCNLKMNLCSLFSFKNAAYACDGCSFR